MGLRNAPLTFQRMVNFPFPGLIGNGMFCYLDDLIIVSKDLESHLHKLDLVFTKLEEAGLKAKLSKSDFLTSSMEKASTLLIPKSTLLSTFQLLKIWRRCALS